MSTADPPEVKSFRDAYYAAFNAIGGPLYDYETALDALREGKRKQTDVTALQNALTAAESAFNDARDAEATAFSALQGALAAWLPSSTDKDPAAAQTDVGRLDAKYPIVMFPVRVETRFDAGFLKVRISPDEIFLYTHEFPVTKEEDDAGRKYWEQFIAGVAEQKLWRDIVARFGVQRAAYVVNVARPFNPDGSEGGPIWPTLAKRSSSWTRPGFAVLPDRWAVYVYKNGARRGPYYSARIVEPLQQTPDPKLRESELVEFAPGHTIDPRLQWNVNFDVDTGRDFDNALKVGMGVAIPLEGDDATTGFDRVTVIGVKTSMGSSSMATLLGTLFDGHHYTTGFELVRQGTATNNIEGQPSSYPVEENAGELSFQVERVPFTFFTGSDAGPLYRVMGLDSHVVTNIRGNGGVELSSSQAMRRALWPATFGYYMRYMLESVISTQTIFSKDQIAWAREYFCNYVRPRGSVPAFRIGSVPYGVLPVAALGPWKERNYRSTTPDEVTQPQNVEAAMLKPLKTLYAQWLEAAAGVDRVQGGRSNPDIDIAKILATYPSAKEFRIRWGIGKDIQGLHVAIFGIDISAWVMGLEVQSNDTFALLGHPEWRPRLGYMLFDQAASTYTGEVIAPLPLSEDQSLPGDFITGIHEAEIADLSADNVAGKPGNENLLYSVLRHSTLMAYLLGYADTLPSLPDWEYFFIPSSMGPPATLSQLFGFTKDQLKALPGVSAHLEGLNSLIGLPTAELERLFTETLDLSSHRLDAWITAFANRRLDEMRLANGYTPDDFFGAYGWVENVRPGARPVVTLPDLGDVPTQENSGGFVQAPSMTHVYAAAVLRGGHLSVKSENGAQSAGTYAVDLSSQRVRLGRRLFEGVRNGQPLGALLGYEFERRLHESSTPGLDPIRFTLRKFCPLVANQAGDDGSEPSEAIAARNVVDGATLIAKRATLPWGSAGLPAVGTTQYNAVIAEIDRLTEMFDATADLLTAEGVFQLVRGNIDAAVPSINNIVEGAQPPDTVVSKSTRGGVGLTHRVLLVFPSDDAPALPTGTWPPSATPRALAEPVLNAWIGQIIGDPSQIVASLRYLDAQGAVITSTPSGGAPQPSVTVSLHDLGIHPLDALAIARVIAQKNQGSLLDWRIITAALGDPAKRPDAPPARFELTYDVSGSRSFLDLFEILNAVSRVLADARPLKVEDLVSPAEIADALEEAQAVPDQAAKDFYARSAPVRTALSAALGALDDALSAGTGYRAALVQAAAFGPLSAFPDPNVLDTDLQASAQSRRDELNAKSASLPAPLTDSALGTLKGTTIIAAAMQVFTTLVGDDLIVVPPLKPPRGDELDLSLQARGDLLNGDDEAPDRYLQQAMRLREKLSRFRKLGLYARTAGAARPRIDVLQVPYQPGERWLGVPFETSPEEARTAALVVNYASELHATGATWTGLFLDHWTEIIPNQSEDTGIAVNYEGPRVKAPQTVLIATPSGSGANWVWDELVQSVEQAFDLAQIRAVDRDLLGIGQLIPAAVFTTNENPDNTVSTAFSSIAQPPPDQQGLEQ